MEIIDYGVCRLSVVAVQKEAGFTQERVTSLLFGDHYEVLSQSKDKQWYYIRIYFDQVEGWIDRRQHHSISKDYFDQINQADFKITTDVTSTILYKKSPLSIVMGSIVPISQSELFKMEEQFAFNGESKSIGLKRDEEFLRTTALKYLNSPEQQGGKSPFGIDAQGFTQMIFKISGYLIPHEMARQSTAGKKVNEVTDMQPGDIAFFKNSNGEIIHSGIVLSANSIIHVDGQVKTDHLSHDGILNQEQKTITHPLAFLRRIL